MNTVILIGRIGNDPDKFTFDNGNMVSKFSLATSENYKDKTTGEWKESTEWHNIVIYKDTKLRKGDLISVEGKIITRKWEKDGRTNYTTEIIARKVSLLSRKDNTSQPPMPAEPQQPESDTQVNTPTEDDLPF